MKATRRIMALLLSAAMMFTYLPVMTFAEEDGNDGENSEVTEPVSAEASVFLKGVIGTDKLYNLETPGVQRFNVTFSDGSEKTFVYSEQEYEGEDEPYTIGEFVYCEDPNAYEDVDLRTAENYLYAGVDDEGEKVSFEEGWNYNVKLKLIVHYVVSGEGTDDVVTDTKVLYTYADVFCAYDRKPLSVQFIPASGFTPDCTAGYNYLTEETFYGEGNAFKVSYEGWDDGEKCYTSFSRTYYYTKNQVIDGKKVEGFIYPGRDHEVFMFDEGVFCDLRYGKQVKVEFSYSEYVTELGKNVVVNFTIPVKATRYEPYTNWPIFTYNGKVKTVTLKTFKVYDNDGHLIPSKYYTVKQAKKTGKMGWYDATITFKSSVRAKYGKSITTFYGIGPAVPKFKKIAAGNKKLSVQWKKFTNAQLKNMDGMYIEISTDKNFVNNYKKIRINKKTIKAGKKIIKGLKKGKRYYIRMYTYKKITQDGEKFAMPSKESAVKYKTTK